jgi:hypothetical protein
MRKLIVTLNALTRLGGLLAGNHQSLQLRSARTTFVAIHT